MPTKAQLEQAISDIRSHLYDAIHSKGEQSQTHVDEAYLIARKAVKSISDKKYQSVRWQPFFDKTWCSQCGKEFGPGKHGYSHCIDHAT